MTKVGELSGVDLLISVNICAGFSMSLSEYIVSHSKASLTLCKRALRVLHRPIDPR